MTTLTSGEAGEAGRPGGAGKGDDDGDRTAPGPEVDGAVPPDAGRRQPGRPGRAGRPVRAAGGRRGRAAQYAGTPLLDLAQTELRVRDVGGSHTPLVGLAGRIQAYGQQGSHPGR